MLYKLAEKEIDLLMESYRNPVILKDNWILVNKKEYTKNKGKITLTSADFYLNKQVIKEKGFENYTNKNIFINAETKNKYILIKYNSNFVAINISDTEYGLTIYPMKLICARNIAEKDILTDKSEPPTFKYLLNLLGWKITKQALVNIKKQDDYI